MQWHAASPPPAAAAGWQCCAPLLSPRCPPSLTFSRLAPPPLPIPCPPASACDMGSMSTSGYAPAGASLYMAEGG